VYKRQEDYLRSYYGDMGEWGPDGEPLNEAAECEFFYGGDRNMMEANRPEF
jgi:hypothetical protein